MTDEELIDDWRKTSMDAGDMYNLLMGTADGLEAGFADAVEAKTSAPLNLQISKGALFHTTNALRAMAKTIKVTSEAKVKEQLENLTPSQKLHAQGFRHTCGGGVIGCRCFENWQYQKEVEATLNAYRTQTIFDKQRLGVERGEVFEDRGSDIWRE